MIESSHDVPLLGSDSLFGDLLVGDFVMDERQREGVDLFILTSHEHRADTDLMKIRGLKGLLGLFKVPIHVVHRKEERLVLALVGTEHLDHSVDHLGSQVFGDVVAFQAVFDVG